MEKYESYLGFTTAPITVEEKDLTPSPKKSPVDFKKMMQLTSRNMLEQVKEETVFAKFPKMKINNASRNKQSNTM
jgi:hypothetical protein